MSAPREKSDDRLLAFLEGKEGRGGVEMARPLSGDPELRTRAVEYVMVGRILGELDPADGVFWHRFETPFGETYAAVTARGLARLSWQQPGEEAFTGELEERFPEVPVIRDPGRVAAVERQLGEYFARERDRFQLPVDLEGMGEFQRSVLRAVRGVGYGQVVPYAELARRIRRPKASRAVGNALGRNPVAIVVPCHRVVRSDGSLGGYTGGLEYKERLLVLEGRDDLLRAG